MSSSDEHAESVPESHPTIHHVQAKAAKVAERAKSTGVARLYGRLTAVDFMNSAFIFSVLVVVCLFPALVIIADLTGKSVQKAVITRLGLNAQAAKDVDGLIGSGHGALASLTVIGVVFLVLCIVGIAATLQGWYEKVFDQQPTEGLLKPYAIRIGWFAVLVAYLWLEVLIGQQTGPAGGRVLTFLCEFVVSVLFWWWSVHVLLSGRIGWRRLFPTGLATAICLTGLSVFSALLFSNSIISDEKSYGSIGVMMVLLSYCIGLGVVIHIGAVFGRMWDERHSPVAEMSSPGASEPIPARPGPSTIER
jgi:membrane protein